MRNTQVLEWIYRVYVFCFYNFYVLYYVRAFNIEIVLQSRKKKCRFPNYLIILHEIIFCWRIVWYRERSNLFYFIRITMCFLVSQIDQNMWHIPYILVVCWGRKAKSRDNSKQNKGNSAKQIKRKFSKTNCR